MRVFLPLALVAVFAAMPEAQASTVSFSFTQNSCSGGCSPSPFGTVTLTDEGSGAAAYVLVSETLTAGEEFAGTGAGKSLGFNIDFIGLITLTSLEITNLTSGFTAGDTSYKAAGIGSFSDYVDCSICTGGNPGQPTSLSFDVSSTAGAITTASFITDSAGYYFASDILAGNGNTGNVANNTPGTVSATPEPATFGLIGLSLVGFGLLRRKRKTSRRPGGDRYPFFRDQAACILPNASPKADHRRDPKSQQERGSGLRHRTSLAPTQDLNGAQCIGSGHPFAGFEL
jgi:hypothetical protein